MEVDHEIENFWLNFKKSLFNFYDNPKINFDRPINEWSNYLNKLQEQKDYVNIEKSIIKYISLYAIDIMKVHDTYHMNILNTNIKRWDKISIKYKIYNSDKNDYCNLIFILFDIYCYLYKKKKFNKKLFDELELYLFFNDFKGLILYAYENNCYSIIEKLIKYDEKLIVVLKEVLNIDIEINTSISFRKLIKLINDIKDN